MRRSQRLPALWLISDARNDAELEAALARLPRGSGLVFRHYHLGSAARRARFVALARIARRRGIVVALAGSPALARRWRADAIYGPPARIAQVAGLARATGLARIGTVHSRREAVAARRAGADLVFVSPVHATRSHPGARPLGRLRARAIAAQAQVPAVMLGGMDTRRARALRPYGWAAIDGLVIR